MEKSLFENILNDGLALNQRRNAVMLIERFETELRGYRETSLTKDQLLDELEKFCLRTKQDITRVSLY